MKRYNQQFIGLIVAFIVGFILLALFVTPIAEQSAKWYHWAALFSAILVIAGYSSYLFASGLSPEQEE